MRPEALAQARDRLEKAQAAFERLRTGKNMAAKEAAWTAFLLAANSIYSKLEKGAKGSGASEAWFGRMKHVRRTDELLSYIHHARNADEHGIEAITEQKTEELARQAESYYGVPAISKAELVINYSYLKLVPVSDDRFGDTFQVPTMHLGQQIKDQTPLTIASLALDSLRGMLSEAAGFVPASSR